MTWPRLLLSRQRQSEEKSQGPAIIWPLLIKAQDRFQINRFRRDASSNYCGIMRTIIASRHCVANAVSPNTLAGGELRLQKAVSLGLNTSWNHLALGALFVENTDVMIRCGVGAVSRGSLFRSKTC
jgi:hypothetical protein